MVVISVMVIIMIIIRLSFDYDHYGGCDDYDDLFIMMIIPDCTWIAIVFWSVSTAFWQGLQMTCYSLQTLQFHAIASMY